MRIDKDKSDIELVEQFKAGLAEAFDELMSRYASKMYQTAYGLIGSRQDAEEVVQDTFIRVHRYMRQFRGDASFSTWIYRIAVNLSRNKYHWNHRRGVDRTISLSTKSSFKDSNEKEEINVLDTKHKPDRIIQEAEGEKGVMEAIDRLPSKLREVMILRHVEDMSYEEISNLLECNLGTVKSRLARAREGLAKVLNLNPD